MKRWRSFLALAGGQFDRPRLVSDRNLYGIGFDRSNLATGDFNADGVIDVATTNSVGGLGVSLGIASGGFGPELVIEGTEESKSPVLVDFDSNGTLDIVVANDNQDSISFYSGDGAGQFLESTVFDIGHRAFSVTSADFDGDGNLDLAVAGRFDDQVSILLGDGGGDILSTETVSANDATAIVAGDFNNDGVQDIAVTNSGSGEISLLTGNGDGTFASAIDSLVSATPFTTLSLSTADIDGDGIVDIAVGNSSEDTVTILFGSSTGLSDLKVLEVRNRTIGVELVDIDQDGAIDLLSYGGAGGVASVLVNLGSRQFSDESSFAIWGSPTNLVIEDVNRDGSLDAVFVDRGSDSVVLLKGLTNSGF